MKRLAIGAAIFICALSPSAAQELDASVIDAAKKEGKVVWYTAFASPRSHQTVIDAFERKYGVKVELLNVRATEVAERIRTEQTTRRYAGDIVQTSDATAALYTQSGFIEPHGGVPNAARMIDGQPPTATHMASIINAFGITANASLVTAGDAPKSWRDLLDPKWKGKILSDDMRAGGGGFSMFSALMLSPAHGEDFHRSLAKQDISFTRDVGQGERRVARGEFAIWIPQHSGNVSGLQGLPLRIIAPAEGVPYTRLDLARLTGAPHPNAARLFMNFYLSDEMQQAVASFGGIPVIKGVEDRLPAQGRTLEKAKLLGTIPAAEQERFLKLANEIYR